MLVVVDAGMSGGMTRRAALCSAMAAAGLVTLGGCGAEPGLPPAAFVDDFTTVPDGPLDRRRTPGGHVWRSGGADEDPSPVIYHGAIGPPSGHIPGALSPGVDNNLAAAAGYASVLLPSPVTRIGAEYRWDQSTSRATGLAVGTADFPPGRSENSGPSVRDDLDSPARKGGSSAHLSINPTGIQFATFSQGVHGDFSPLVPVGWGTTVVFFPAAQACDGRTVHRVNIAIDRTRSVARVDVSGLPTLYFADPRISSVPAIWPFWEYYSVPGGTNLPRFTRVWADHR